MHLGQVALDIENNGGLIVGEVFAEFYLEATECPSVQVENVDVTAVHTDEEVFVIQRL